MKTDLRTVKRNQQQIQKQIEHLEDSMNSKTAFPLKTNLPKPTLPGSSADECIHGEVLQDHLKIFVEEVDLDNGFIVDEMLKNDDLTVTEVQEIKHLSRPDKTRKLATILGRKSKIEFINFLNILAREEFSPHIASLLRNSYETKLKEGQIHSKCIRCFIIQKVDVKQILDDLCAKRFIGLDDVDNVIKEGGYSYNRFWKEAFGKISISKLGERHLSNFKEALREHYPHIARKIQNHSDLLCTCPSTFMSYPSSSLGDVSENSTSSTEQKQKGCVQRKRKLLTLKHLTKKNKNDEILEFNSSSDKENSPLEHGEEISLNALNQSPVHSNTVKEEKDNKGDNQSKQEGPANLSKIHISSTVQKEII